MSRVKIYLESKKIGKVICPNVLVTRAYSIEHFNHSDMLNLTIIACDY